MEKTECNASRKSSPEGFDREFANRLPLRILLVEDNAINQKLALLLLARIGYRADTANDGVEALRAIHRQRAQYRRLVGAAGCEQRQR